MHLSSSLLHSLTLLATDASATRTTTRPASSGGPNYFPALNRKNGAGPSASAAAAAHNAHLSPLPGGRRHSLTEADALAARRWALPRGSSMSDPAMHARGPLAPGVFVVEGGPAVATPGFHPLRSSVADPDWIAAPLPDHRAP